jgi:hypothetical protein
MHCCRWACSVVHSRTFGMPSKAGGVGMRALVPVLDMFNHAGDEAHDLLSSAPTARDNCGWGAVAPERSASGKWAMKARFLVACASVGRG